MDLTYNTENERRVAIILAARGKPLSASEIVSILAECGYKISPEDVKQALQNGPFRTTDKG